MDKSEFIRRHREQSDRFVQQHESLSAYEEFVRMTGPAIVSEAAVALQERPRGVFCEVECGFCGALGVAARCTNCGAAKGT